jgi:hypothetical protein
LAKVGVVPSLRLQYTYSVSLKLVSHIELLGSIENTIFAMFCNFF